MIQEFPNAPQEEKVEQPKQVFDPTLKYEWDSDQDLIIKGKEFDIIYNSLRAFMDKNNIVNTLRLIDAFNVTTSMLVRYANNGDVKPQEVKEETK